MRLTSHIVSGFFDCSEKKYEKLINKKKQLSGKIMPTQY